MFEQDYLMKLLLAFYQAMFKSLRRVTDEDEDPKEAAATLDEVVGNAVGMDGASLLSLTPESVVGVLQVSGTDPRVTEFIARSLLLSSEYLTQAKQGALASLRVEQARAIADAYGIDLPDDPTDLSDLKEMAEQANAGSGYGEDRSGRYRFRG